MGLTVFAAISEDKVIGPYFFSEPPPRGTLGPYFKPCTVNSTRNLEMLRNWFLPQWNAVPNAAQSRIMQDGAPPHFALDVRDFLNTTFGERWIGRGVEDTNLSWPPRSPDLTPCDFFLWGHIKEVVYRRNPQNYYQLMDFITEAFAELDPLMLLRVFNSIPARYENCVKENGKQQL